MNRKRQPSLEMKINLAREYLKEKYGEEFGAFDITESGWGRGHDEIYLYPKIGNKEKDKFTVWGTLRDDKCYGMHDGYFGVIIRDEYEAVMSGFVKEIYKDFKLYINFDSGIVHPDRLNKETKINEIYNKDESFASYTTIFVKQSSAEGINTAESLKRIAKKMKENKLAGKVIIYIAFDDRYEVIDYYVLNKDTLEYFVESRKYIWVNQNLVIDEGE
jgi:hypothetical protein